MGGYAHFENVGPYVLHDLYTRHAEVARDIHQDALRKFTGNSELTVDLVRMSTVDVNTETLEKMSDYDVVSASEGLTMGAVIQAAGLNNGQTVKEAQAYFQENETPIYVVAAGNDGKTENQMQARLADFSRNSLVVGEANVSDGKVFIEDHSSRINPTIASDSPFNNGARYQYVNPSPSLEGHEKLVREWIVDRTAKERFEQYKDNPPQELAGKPHDQMYLHIKDGLKDEGFAQSDQVNKQVEEFMTKPEELHTLVREELNEKFKKYGIDENGYVENLDGTSFSGPELAGHVSGAMYEQEMRAEKGLPALTKDEVTSLTKMATFDTQLREGTSDFTYMYNNVAGHKLTPTAGHGVFEPQMFKDLLEEAYSRIETDPDINRDPVELRMDIEIETGGYYDKYVAKVPDSNETDVVIDRVCYEASISGFSGHVPEYFEINKPGQKPSYIGSQTARDDENHEMVLWRRSEHDFGETIKAEGETWEISPVTDHVANDYRGTSEDVGVIVYGYKKGGLMDGMMEHAKENAPNPGHDLVHEKIFDEATQTVADTEQEPAQEAVPETELVTEQEPAPASEVASEDISEDVPAYEVASEDTTKDAPAPEPEVVVTPVPGPLMTMN